MIRLIFVKKFAESAGWQPYQKRDGTQGLRKRGATGRWVYKKMTGAANGPAAAKATGGAAAQGPVAKTVITPKGTEVQEPKGGGDPQAAAKEPTSEAPKRERYARKDGKVGERWQVGGKWRYGKAAVEPLHEGEYDQLKAGKAKGKAAPPPKEAKPKAESTESRTDKAVSQMRKDMDKLPGGKADSVPDKAMPQKAIAKGVKHEQEHTSDPQIAKEIAKDHIAEHGPDYYDKLKEVESKPTKKPIPGLVDKDWKQAKKPKDETDEPAPESKPAPNKPLMGSAEPLTKTEGKSPPAKAGELPASLKALADAAHDPASLRKVAEGHANNLEAHDAVTAALRGEYGDSAKKAVESAYGDGKSLKLIDKYEAIGKALQGHGKGPDTGKPTPDTTPAKSGEPVPDTAKPGAQDELAKLIAEQKADMDADKPKKARGMKLRFGKPKEVSDESAPQPRKLATSRTPEELQKMRVAHAASDKGGGDYFALPKSGPAPKVSSQQSKVKTWGFQPQAMAKELSHGDLKELAKQVEGGVYPKERMGAVQEAMKMKSGADAPAPKTSSSGTRGAEVYKSIVDKIGKAGSPSMSFDDLEKEMSKLDGLSASDLSATATQLGYSPYPSKSKTLAMLKNNIKGLLGSSYKAKTIQEMAGQPKPTPMPAAAQETKPVASSAAKPAAMPEPANSPQSNDKDWWAQHRAKSEKAKAARQAKTAEKREAKANQTPSDSTKILSGRSEHEASKEANRLRTRPDEYVRAVAKDFVKGYDIEGLSKSELIQVIKYQLDDNRNDRIDQQTKRLEQSQRTQETKPASAPPAAQKPSPQSGKTVDSHVADIKMIAEQGVKGEGIDSASIASKMKELRNLPIGELQKVADGLGLKERKTGKARSENTVRSELLERIKNQQIDSVNAILANRDAETKPAAKPASPPTQANPKTVDDMTDQEWDEWVSKQPLIQEAQETKPVANKSAAAQKPSPQSGKTVDSHVADLKSLKELATPKKGGWKFPESEVSAKLADLKKLSPADLQSVVAGMGLEQPTKNKAFNLRRIETVLRASARHSASNEQ